MICGDARKKDMYWDTIIKPADRNTDSKDSKVKVGLNLKYIFHSIAYSRKQNIVSFIQTALPRLSLIICSFGENALFAWTDVSDSLINIF